MTIMDCRPFLAVGVSFLAAVLISFSRRYPNVRESWSVIASFIKFGLIISMVPGVLAGVTYEWTLFQITDTIGFTLRADSAGILFACLAALLWIPINFYSIGYMRCNNEHEQTGYFAAFAICMSSVMGIAMASNLLTFFFFYELLTIASLVQSEGIEDDFGKVARVIHNRITEPQMRLQLDSTINYPLDKPTLLTKAEDRKQPGPYNSYQNYGLPPTPISTVSKAALQAAEKPDPGTWVYFVKCYPDGHSCFATTQAEHDRYIQEAQQRGAF